MNPHAFALEPESSVSANSTIRAGIKNVDLIDAECIVTVREAACQDGALALQTARPA